MLPALETLRDIVRTAAREELMARFAEVARHIKHDGSVVTEADVAMQHRLKADLAHRWPEYDFLGEEMAGHEHERLTATTSKGLWCVDPLDGTSNYATGIPFFAVSLALLVDGRPEIGLVYDPVRDECFMARRGQGARLNDIALGVHEPPPPEVLRRCIAAVDFKRLAPALAARLGARPPYGSQRNFGASSLEWCWLADGRFHLYLHGGQKLWDYTGGHLVLTEAGGRACTLEGEEVFTHSLKPRSVVAAVTPALFSDWKAWVDEHRSLDPASSEKEF
ncbi:MAG TPA: inositol monophosphatase family protein, partial [Albitalea sp.]|nr:inositol monophosphatase family protein [Albitalea sp.]